MRQRIETHQSQPFIADRFRRFFTLSMPLAYSMSGAAMIAPGRFLPFFTLQLPHFSHPFLRQLNKRVLLVCNAVRQDHIQQIA